MLEAVLPSAGGNITSFPETLALLLLYLVKADAEVLIIDGIDECIDGNRLIHSQNAFIKRTSMRIIATSRPGSLPATQKYEMELLNLEQDQIRSDITAYLECGTETGPLSAPELRQPAVDEVLYKGNGMFLWIKAPTG